MLLVLYTLCSHGKQVGRRDVYLTGSKSPAHPALSIMDGVRGASFVQHQQGVVWFAKHISRSLARNNIFRELQPRLHHTCCKMVL